MRRSDREVRKRLAQYQYITNRLKKSTHERSADLLLRFTALLEGGQPGWLSVPELQYWLGKEKPSFETKKEAERSRKRYLTPISVQASEETHVVSFSDFAKMLTL